MNDADIVLTALMRDVTRFFADEVQIHAAWIETEQSVCVVFSRRIDSPHVLLGRRFQFPPYAREDDPASAGAAYAEQLREPPGSLWKNAIRDSHGVAWLAVTELPKPPYGNSQ